MGIAKPEVIGPDIVNKYDDAVVVNQFATDGASSYQEMRVSLARLAEQSKASDNDRAWVYAIFADMCGLMFAVKHDKVIYEPFARIGGRRSFSICDLTHEVAAVIGEVAVKVSNVHLRARILDVVGMWLKGDAGRQFRMDALSAYLQHPIQDNDHWLSEERLLWRRAVELARIIGEEAKASLAELTSRWLNEATSPNTDKITALQLCQMAVDCKLVTNENFQNVASTLERIYYSFTGESAYLNKSECAKTLQRLFALFCQKDKKSGAIILHANAWADDGDYWYNEKNDKTMAAFRYEKAEQIISALSKDERKSLGYEQKLAMWIDRKHEGFEYWAKNMKREKVLDLNISETVNAVREFMSVNEAQSALCRFLHVYRFTLKDLNRYVSAAKQHGLRFLFANILMDDTGRVTYRSESDDGRMSEGEFARFFVGYITQSHILVALNELRKFNLCKTDFDAIAKQSSPVLEKRRRTLALAWWLGYSGDFHAAAMLLVPQIEYLVAKTLERFGIKTTFISPGTSVESFKALSTLLEDSNAASCLGLDLHKELLLLFGGAPYYNARNLYAHGLIDDVPEDSCLPIDVYIWWLSFRLALTKEIPG